MSTPPMSDATTHGIRVGAAAFYLPDESDPASSQWVFGYNIVIANNSETRVQLLRRHWRIIDGDGAEHHGGGDREWCGLTLQGSPSAPGLRGGRGGSERASPLQCRQRDGVVGHPAGLEQGLEVPAEAPAGFSV